MWTLHKLSVAKRKRSPQDALAPETAGARPEPTPDDDTRGQNETELIPTLDERVERLGVNLTSPWDFTQDELRMFPALQKRNFWCIQRHQARGRRALLSRGCLRYCMKGPGLMLALHYDLRMQLDGTTMSWAVPRGLLGELLWLLLGS